MSQFTFGRFVAPAAHEPGWIVEAELFRVEISAAVSPANEIEEIVWVNPADPGDLPLASLTRDHVLPIASRLTPDPGEAPFIRGIE